MKLLTIILVFILCGCGSEEKRVEKSKILFREVEKFDQLFDHCHTSIKRHSGSPGPLISLSKVRLYGRYMIRMGFNYDESITNGISHPNAKFKITVKENYYRNDLWTSRVIGNLDIEEWRQVKKVEDVFQKISVKPIIGKPIKEFVVRPLFK